MPGKISAGHSLSKITNVLYIIDIVYIIADNIAFDQRIRIMVDDVTMEASIGERLLRRVEVGRDCVDLAFIERTGQIGHAR